MEVGECVRDTGYQELGVGGRGEGRGGEREGGGGEERGGGGGRAGDGEEGVRGRGGGG